MDETDKGYALSGSKQQQALEWVDQVRKLGYTVLVITKEMVDSGRLVKEADSFDFTYYDESPEHWEAETH